MILHTVYCYVLAHAMYMGRWNRHKADMERENALFRPFCFRLHALAQLATAQASNADTYRAVIAHGVVIVTPEMEIDVSFTADGKFAAFKGISTGVWRIEGDSLCSTPNKTLIESCVVYPAGKKSGDTLEVKAPGTSVTIRIR